MQVQFLGQSLWRNMMEKHLNSRFTGLQEICSSCFKNSGFIIIHYLTWIPRAKCYQISFFHDVWKRRHTIFKSDWPFNKVPNLYKMYYMIGMSYHLEDTISHFFHPIQNDFFEMLLHHYITIMLVVGSHMTSFWNFGIVVMIQMDICDISVSCIKAFIDFCSPTVVFINYLVMLSSWTYFRIIVFSIERIEAVTLRSGYSISSGENLLAPFVILLIGVLMLNIY
ncbi:unnamed protein product [Moneuplotes crassus]|uniref:TLC domain-containing protein n=1 Tax=Euplotes crassus TaxID=5936 RepID=A0AAD1XKV5_EUPCR|nr:unnamed protein product [Moneuplotes crassus]